MPRPLLRMSGRARMCVCVCVCVCVSARTARNLESDRVLNLVSVLKIPAKKDIWGINSSF